MKLSFYLKIFLCLVFYLSTTVKAETRAINSHLATYISSNSNFNTDVIDIKEQQLSANYWLKKLPRTKNQADQVLLTKAEINNQNQIVIDNNPFVNDPLAIGDTLSKQALLNIINSISKVPSGAHFYENGKQLTQKNYQHYLLNLNKQALKQNNKIHFGLVVKRSSLRTFPTTDKVFNLEQDHDIDRFQESAVFPGDVVAILYTSTDNKWLLVQAYNYVAWLGKSAVAVGEKKTIKNYKNTDDFLVVTGSKIFTNFIPKHPEISNLQLDMGIRLPLAKRSEYGNSLYGQNPYANYVVKLPTRDKQGKLHLVLALISRSQDVYHGYLPFTKVSIITQSFKFLGERYGWGHSYNGRDCTGFVGEVFKTFGFIMPRNTGTQNKAAYGINQRFSMTNKHDKKLASKHLVVGDLIYIPGHVMIFIGYEQDKPFVIHDVKNLTYLQANGMFYHGTLNSVAVTPLLPLYSSALVSYMDEITTIKRLTKAKK
jgi:hypothetical protein